MSVVLNVLHLYAPESHEYEDVDEAVLAAYGMIEWNTAWPDTVTENGVVVLDHDALRARISALREAKDS